MSPLAEDDAPCVARLTTYGQWLKYVVLARAVAALEVRDKRALYQLLRQHEAPDDGHDLFFPRHGFTAGAFCTWTILNETRRPSVAARSTK